MLIGYFKSPLTLERYVGSRLDAFTAWLDEHGYRRVSVRRHVREVVHFAAWAKKAGIPVSGKGRKERSLPLWKQTASDLRAWLAVRGNVAVPELFVNARGESMTRKGFTYLLDKYTEMARQRCTSLREKQVSPHALRHACAMMMLQATGDLRKVSLEDDRLPKGRELHPLANATFRREHKNRL
jgi:integrase